MTFNSGLRIGFDMDEVICDTHSALVSWAEVTFGLSLQARACEPMQALLTDQQALVMTDMLNEGSFFRRLSPMEGAVEVLRQLITKHDVFIVTAAMEHPGSMAHKFEWILEHLPFFSPLNVVFCGEKYIVDVDYLVDDNPHHFERLRGDGLIFTAPANIAETRYRRVHTWSEIASIFDGQRDPEHSPLIVMPVSPGDRSGSNSEGTEFIA